MYCRCSSNSRYWHSLNKLETQARRALMRTHTVSQRPWCLMAIPMGKQELAPRAEYSCRVGPGHLPRGVVQAAGAFAGHTQAAPARGISRRYAGRRYAPSSRARAGSAAATASEPVVSMVSDAHASCVYIGQAPRPQCDRGRGPGLGQCRGLCRSWSHWA